MRAVPEMPAGFKDYAKKEIAKRNRYLFFKKVKTKTIAGELDGSLSSTLRNMKVDPSLSNKLLTNPNSRFIPEKFLYKFQQVTKQTRPDPLKFMCLVNELYFYLCKLVQKHYTIEQVDRLIPYLPLLS